MTRRHAGGLIREHEALRLVVLGGLSYRESARVLGYRSPDSVGRLVEAALGRLATEDGPLPTPRLTVEKLRAAPALAAAVVDAHRAHPDISGAQAPALDNLPTLDPDPVTAAAGS